MGYLLGVDVGTTGTKSAIYADDGTLVDRRYASYPVYYGKEGWAEQEAEDWWNAVGITVRSLVQRNPVNIQAMSLSSQGGCLVLLDGAFRPVHRALSWMDRRAGEISRLLTQEISPRELYRSSGWPVTNGLTFPTAYWFLKKRPAVFRKARYLASTIDYLNYRLTGRLCIDHTNLALTGFLDLETKGLNRHALDVLGIDENNVACIVPSGAPIGTLTPQASEYLGLRTGVVVVSGAHDQYCANMGLGAIQKGHCVLDAGTSWVLLAVCGRLYFAEGNLEKQQGLWGNVFPGLHPLKGKYGLMTVVPFGGSSLRWFRDTFGREDSMEEITAEASGVDPGCRGLLFIPFATSHSGGGAFIGIDTAHTAAHHKRAVLEGVALANRLNFRILEESGLRIKRIMMTGGGAASTVWPAIVADVLGIPVEVPRLKDPECLGAAVLAGMGAGVYRSPGDIQHIRRENGVVCEPDRKRMGIYKRIYQEFLSKVQCI
jgi:xylulokinase